MNHWDVPRWGVGYFDWKQKRNTSVARLMKDAGYTTTAAGKWQINDFRVEPQAMNHHGFDDWLMWTGYEEGNPASAHRYADPDVTLHLEDDTVPSPDALRYLIRRSPKSAESAI